MKFSKIFSSDLIHALSIDRKSLGNTSKDPILFKNSLVKAVVRPPKSFSFLTRLDAGRNRKEERFESCRPIKKIEKEKIKKKVAKKRRGFSAESA